MKKSAEAFNALSDWYESHILESNSIFVIPSEVSVNTLFLIKLFKVFSTPLDNSFLIYSWINGLNPALSEVLK